MRILTVGNMYPPHHLGGYELVWQGAVRSLRAAGHTVRVLTSDFQGEKIPAEADPDEDVHRELRWYWRDHRFPRLGPGARLAIERHNARVLSRHLEDFEPELISWWAMGGMSLSLIGRTRRAGIPSLAVVCDDWMLYGPRVDAWQRPLARFGAVAAMVERGTGIPTRVDLTACVESWVFLSRTVRDRAIEVGWRPRRAEIANPGVDRALFAPAPEQEWCWRLAYVGRIDRRKGIDVAIEALALLPGEATLTIDGGGDDAYLGELQQLVADRDLGRRVEFTRSPRDRLPAVYAAHDVILFPVRWAEPWGLVPLEAMAVGRPVIASGLGGSGEYLADGQNCLIADPSSGAGAVAHAVERLVDEPALRRRIVTGGRRTSMRYPHDAFNQRVLRACERVREPV